jgi:hypothetical protein
MNRPLCPLPSGWRTRGEVGGVGPDISILFVGTDLVEGGQGGIVVATYQ